MKSLARERDKAEILRRLRTVRPDSVRRWGRMSAPQMICHLIDAMRMAMGNKPVTPATGLAQRTIIKGIALYAPLRWPAGIPTSPEIDQEIGGTVPTSFAADVAELEGLVALFASRRDATWPLHPVFGRMSETAWYRWAYLHTDHHLRQFGV
jgi:Protein of unknown function (DUF1569)